uniref:Uncharacterized protein n=1 Tax=Anguilla anguilla TaxID=7936 RepID=A0A0E9RV89_ANGAN
MRVLAACQSLAHTSYLIRKNITLPLQGVRVTSI